MKVDQMSGPVFGIDLSDVMKNLVFVWRSTILHRSDCPSTQYVVPCLNGSIHSLVIAKIGI